MLNPWTVVLQQNLNLVHVGRPHLREFHRKVLDLARSDTSEDLERHVNLRDMRGQTTLHHAVEKAPIGLFNSLLDSDANPNLTDDEGNAVLHSLYSSENPVDLVQKLERLPVSIIPIYQRNNRGAIPILCILWGSSNADGKRLNKWEALNELRKSSAGFKGMSSRGVVMDFWRVLNAGRIACIWKKKEKIPRVLPQ